jgi:hypothetical protein
MAHPITICQIAYKKYRDITLAAHKAALKDADFQIALQVYAEHLRDCQTCRAELEKDGITISLKSEPIQ